MPISRDQLETSKKTTEEKIYDFLASHPGEAFDIWEILSGVIESNQTAISLVRVLLLIRGENEDNNKYNMAIMKLVKAGHVEEGYHKGVKYYAVKERS